MTRAYYYAADRRYWFFTSGGTESRA